jgi:hypothetical protein
MSAELTVRRVDDASLSPAVDSLEEALGKSDCPLGRNEWLAADGTSLTPQGEAAVVEYCWEAYVRRAPT